MCLLATRGHCNEDHSVPGLTTKVAAVVHEPRFFLTLVYRYLNTETTPGICRDGFRNVLLAVRAEACGRFCGSMMLAEALAEALSEPPGDPT